MDPYRNNQCVPCRPSQTGFISRTGVSVSATRPLVDVESDLRNINIKNSKDPSTLYRPVCPHCGTCNEGYPCGTGTLKGCSHCGETLVDLAECSIGTSYTRLVNPPCTLKGTGINRFEPLCLNHQHPQLWETERPTNTSLAVKDTFVERGPKPVSQTSALPSESGEQRGTESYAPACRLLVTTNNARAADCRSQKVTW